MDVIDARQLIREKLLDGRLPLRGALDVWRAPGAGESCDGCGDPIVSDQQMMWGVATQRDWTSMHFHEECFGIWDYERGVLSRPPA